MKYLSITLNENLLPVPERLDPATAYAGQYDHILVATSLAIAVLAAYVALSISDRIVAARTRAARWTWTSAGAISMGGGIWSMHFIGMLAFTLPRGVTYSPIGTILSMIPGILASGVALHAISAPDLPSLKRLSVSAVLMGAGIGAMHYAGMAAMRPEALLRYNAGFMGVSVVVAAALALVSLRIHSRRTPNGGFLPTVMAATVMGCAMAGMHYTAMQASVFFPLADGQFAISDLPPQLLAFTIAVIAVLLATSTLVATFAGRQNDLATNLAGEIADRRHIERDLILAREQAEAASVAKSSFLASMSHEIRTPLNGVIGNLELLSLTAPSREQSELIGQGEKAAKSLLALIGNILDFSKIEEGKLTIEMGDVSPSEVVTEAIAVLQPRANKKDLFVGALFDQDLPEIVRSDAVRLRQIILNLVGNALKFTHDGGVVVKVSVLDWDGDLCEIKFTVHDSGRGFDQARGEMLFTPFVQDQVAIDTSEGTGLGLSISRSLVEAMGGSIGCEGVPGEGATFWFKLPMQTVKRAARGRMVELTGYHVAILGGNTSGAALFRRYFKSRGATIVHAANLVSAIAALQPVAGVKSDRNSGVLIAAGDITPDMAKGLRAERIVPLMYASDGSDEAFRRALRAGFAGVFSTAEGPGLLDRNIYALLDHDAVEPAEIAPAADTVALSPVVSGKTILVLEDRQVNQLVIQKQLTKLSVSYVIANDGLEGLAALNERDFDLVLCDCSMPHMNGYDFTRAVRGREKAEDAKHRLPIIALTANAFREDMEKCHQAGMDDFISKPVNLERLCAVLNKWLGATPTSAEPIVLSNKDTAIDLSVLEEVLGEDDTELLNSILAEFARSSKKSHATLEAALANGRVNGVQVAAHGAKGEARSTGAVYLGQIYAEVERYAKAGDLRAAEEAAKELTPEIHRVGAFIDQRLTHAAHAA